MGRRQELKLTAMQLLSVWLEQHDAGAICEVDCGCECHDVDEPPCKACCTYLEDEVPEAGDDAKPGGDGVANPEFRDAPADGTPVQREDGSSPGDTGAVHRFE